MLMFAATGITLNHAGIFEVEREAPLRRLTLSKPDLEHLRVGAESAGRPLPAVIARRIDAGIEIDLAGEAAEWTQREISIHLPRPGSNAVVSIDRETGEVVYEASSRGVVGMFNDLHTGRNTGRGWLLFIDVFAASCLVFTVTGLALLWLSAAKRPVIWPLVGAGAAIPTLLLLLHFL